MKAADHIKILKKCREHTYQHSERNLLDAVIYLLEFQNATEQDIADQIRRAIEEEEQP